MASELGDGRAEAIIEAGEVRVGGGAKPVTRESAKEVGEAANPSAGTEQ